jgi:hypothetical protein
LMPVKPDPQGYGSAVTYARRYDLSALIGLASDDDDGNEASKPANDSKPQGKSPFSNASLRNTFVNNVILSFEGCEKISELAHLGELNKAKIDEMRASGNEHDGLAVEELLKRYKVKYAALKEEEQQETQNNDTKARA